MKNMRKLGAGMFFFLLILNSSIGQVSQKNDGLYYDKNGQLYTGTYYEYFTDTTIRAEISLLNGTPDGLTKIYFESGELQEIRSFRKGQMHGQWEKWNSGGIKTAEANYTNNLKDGKWFVWDDNGTLRYDMTYKDGKKTGTWYMYDDSGKLISEKIY